MKVLCIICLLLFAISYTTTGQYLSEEDPDKKFKRWYYKPAGGVNLPITRLLNADVADNLIAYDDNSFYWQHISFTYFIIRQFGLEFTWQTGASSRYLNRDKRFVTQLEEANPEYYVFITSSGAAKDKFVPIGGNIDRIFLGPVHRIEKDRWLLMPKFLFGTTILETNSAKAYLKQKGGNNLSEVTYEPSNKDSDKETFTLAPAVTIGYRLGKKININLDIIYSFYQSDFFFTETTRNALTQQIETRIIDYKKDVNTLTIGAGLIIEL